MESGQTMIKSLKEVNKYMQKLDLAKNTDTIDEIVDGFHDHNQDLHEFTNSLNDSINQSGQYNSDMNEFDEEFESAYTNGLEEIGNNDR